MGLNASEGDSSSGDTATTHMITDEPQAPAPSKVWFISMNKKSF